jgi:estrogen-related receptor beta like 1
LYGEIEQMLEKISSREKYINGQFEGQVRLYLQLWSSFLVKIDQFKKLQEQSSNSKQKYTVASSNVAELTNELARISDELESVKVTYYVKFDYW